MKTFDKYLEEQLKDEEFKEEYKKISPELDIIKAMLDARKLQNLTQEELAKKNRNKSS